MQNVKQNLLPLITWASFVALAFSTMTEVRNFNRNDFNEDETRAIESGNALKLFPRFAAI